MLITSILLGAVSGIFTSIGFLEHDPFIAFLGGTVLGLGLALLVSQWNIQSLEVILMELEN